MSREYRRLKYSQMQLCVMCGKTFRAFRNDAKLCSPRCRKANSRAVAKS